MDLHCDCAESPAADQPSGKINKTAFKLFGKRKSGSAMPSIFGVKNKGDGKGTGNMGMVRSRTLDGLSDVMLDSNKKDEPCIETDAEKPNTDINTKVVTIKADVSSNSNVAKSNSFFSLLKKNGKSENVKGENAEHKSVSRQKKGLKGLFHSMRWNKKDKIYREDKEGSSENQQGLILPSSLTASLECIKEEIQKTREPEIATEDLTVDLPCEEQTEDVNIAAEEKQVILCEESPSPSHTTEKTQEEEVPGDQHVENLCQLPSPEVQIVLSKQDKELTGEIPINNISFVEPECASGHEIAAPDPSTVDPPSEQSFDRICLMLADVTSLKSFDSLTGCGDIIADPDDDGGNGTSARPIPGNGKKAICKKTPNIVAYQGGGEEMASPEQVDDSSIEELWGMIPQDEDTDKKIVKVNSTSQVSRLGKPTKSTLDGCTVRASKLKPVSIIRIDKGDHKSGGKEQQKCIRNSDEGYWDSTTPCPEEELSRSIENETLPRDSCSGDALYDLYTEPEENTAGAQVEEEIQSLPHSKPLSPVTTTCSVKTAKDSKIPISIKHLPVHQPTHGADSSTGISSSVALPQPVKTEMPRTKIPVSKVLVRRVSNRAVTGTSVKTAYHDLAKK
ncbi:APC membrane recruitment protein 2 [Bombina bombina]|uniref:APC membrane recruitment protein 2 n=1 Tax=Bombina bombina TaxID=8345 RepID=UPI00235A84F1|nr:APC membrane recruitment protein 2 [Bombina bombina]